MKNVKVIIQLQLVVAIYSVSSVVAKMASKQELFSRDFFGLYALEIFLLGVYAIFWQQMLKKIELSIAYANRAMVLVWSLVWAYLGFHEKISINNIVAIVLVMFGTVVINMEGRKND